MNRKVSAIVFILLSFGAGVECAAYDKDPIKSTQTEPVAVTEELLKREGEPGPASPTIAIEDTAEFLAKKPYESIIEEADEYQLEETDSPWWEDWFSWKEDDEKSLDSEPVE